MPLYQGPCEECGEYVERVIRKGRVKVHLECGIARMTRENYRQADRTSDAYAENLARGAVWREQWHKGEGLWYENTWKGWERWVKRSFPTTSPEPDTVTPDQ